VIDRIATGCGMKLDVKRAKGTARGDRAWRITEMTLTRRLRPLMGDYLVWSPQLRQMVALGDWAATHATLDEEEMQLAADAEWAEDCGEELVHGTAGRVLTGDVDPSATDTREQRTEKLDGAALATELHRLREKKTLSAQEERWLQWLEVVDSQAMPSHEEEMRRVGVEASERERVAPAQAFIRYLTVFYGKRRAIGRRTASHPGMQHCPSALRPRLVRQFYHDIDLCNCHPVLFLQVARKMGVDPEEIAVLEEYVGHREAVLARIGEFYGVAPAKCKYAVLRILNGGQVTTWIRDAKCTRNATEVQPDLRALMAASDVVRSAFFAMDQFKPHVAALTDKLRVERKAAVESAEARLAGARSADVQTAKRGLALARMKAQPHAIKRTIFSLCVFELEDSILDAIDKSLKRDGWTVSSLQFDGCHVEHRDGADLDAAMRRAEEAVRRELGYSIELKEKELFHARVEDAEENDTLVDMEQDDD